jgi:hypothetical protein
MRDMIDIHWSQLGMGRGVTTFVDDNRRRGPSSERCRGCFYTTTEVRRVMRDLASWTTGLGAMDGTPTVVYV